MLSVMPGNVPWQALRLVKSDLEETRKQRASLEAELETKDATVSALQSKVGGGSHLTKS
jgi:hypothetical protein